MFKCDVEYENFNGEKKTKVCYFHLSKVDLTELEVEHQGGLQSFIKNIVEAQDMKKLYAEFKRIVLLSYGEKSSDGERFIKKGDEFVDTAAFHELMMKLTVDAEFAAAFVAGVVPADVREDAKKLELAQKTAEKLGITKDAPAEDTNKPQTPLADADLSM